MTHIQNIQQNQTATAHASCKASIAGQARQAAKAALKAKRPIPFDAIEQEYPEADLMVYVFNESRAFIAFKGRQSKHMTREFFSTAAQMQTRLGQFVQRETEREEAKRRRRDTPHGLEVGDVLFSQWGWEQTNVDFFQVVRVPSLKSVVVRQIAKETTPNPETMTGTTMARPGVFLERSKETLHRASGLHRVNGGKVAYGELVKWDGQAKRVSFYA